MRFPSRQLRRSGSARPVAARGLRHRLAALLGALVLLGAMLPALPAASVLASHTAAPTAVTIAGSLQEELGCPGDWQPECATTHLTYDAADTVWQGSFAVPAGSWDYKAPLNDAWGENYGRFAQFDGPNVPLTVGDANATKFYYDHKSHWVTSNRNAAIATVAGSFQQELGCPGDWQPDCLRSWLQDPDEDGVQVFATDDIPAGAYEFKVARNEAWDVSYPDNNVPFTVAALGDTVTFTYTTATNAVAVDVEPTAPPDPDDAVIARHGLRADLTDEVFYFVLPDRFDNGSTANDEGGLTGDRLATGFDPADKGFFHGGDIAGLLDNLDYIEDLGTTAVWMAPLFKNRPVQGTGADVSAGYHGYWITDFTQLDPHFGTNAELEAFVDAAHARGIKVFFDIITNHTADVIDYEEGQYSYRDKGTFPYVDADGTEFDDRDYAGTGTFPPLDFDSFPYSPVFPTVADETVKIPAWLNDRTLYHNRGNSTFAGESANYGDFFGLDDLFTEHPDVQDGMIEIYETWVTEVGIDGYRIDTAKHVNMEFWQAFSPALQEHAASLGNGDFFMFGEVFDSNPAFMSQYTTEGTLQATLDFGFQARATNFAANSAATNELRDFFAQDDYYTDADSNAYSLPTFLGNHDIGRIGRFVSTANPGATDAELLARDRLAHTLMYLVRGMPVVYYGDEQGFTGDGGDKDARQDMMPSEVSSYNDDDLIGTGATTADANFDPTHPIYTSLADLAALKAAHPALRDGAQVHRYSNGDAGGGIYAFSRIGAEEGIEYVVAVNNSEADKSQTIQTYSASAGFTRVWPAGGGTLTSNASGQLSITVPPLSAVVYRADAALPGDTAAPGISIVAPAEGSDVLGRVEVGATLTDPEFAEVTFAVKVGDATDWAILGTDDNAPFRVYHDVTGIAAGTPLLYKAVVMDAAGNLESDTGTAVVGEAEPPAGGAAPDYAVVHYNRPDGNYAGWGVHFWEDIDETVTWETPRPLAGEDDFGRFAWVKLAANPDKVGFIVHQGDTKDPGPDMEFNPSLTPEVWVNSGDSTVYTSQAAAQGFVEIRYQRPDGVYTDWGLHLWGDAIADGVGTDWAAPRMPDDIDDYGAHWIIPIDDPTQPVNFIVHKPGGDSVPETREPGGDRSFLPAAEPAVWLQSGDVAVYGTRGDAEDFAVIHYHRPDGDYGDFSSSNFNDFWGLHAWAGHLDPDPSWESPIKPARIDAFGPVFELDLDDDAAQLAYILHRGNTKDAEPDQTLDLVNVGHEVWYLSGHVDNDDLHKYLLPIQAGTGVDANLAQQKAHWLTENTIAWNIDPIPGGQYALHVAPDGGLAVEGGAITGGTSIPLSRVPAGLSDELKATWPHLANYQAFRIASDDLDLVPDALRGQLAVSAADDEGALRIATGVQIPGVLDDLYPYSGDLGVSWDGDAPTIRVWAPTAKSVALRRFADANTATFTTQAMTRDDATGVWSATGPGAWKGQFYVFEVEVFAPTTGQVETNLVTDPYSFSLATNSTRTQIVNLADAALEPSGWDSVAKPAIAQPEDISLYELHVRDFSINDSTVPATERGTYLAFTHPETAGMTHLRRLAEAGLTHVHLLPVFDIATVEEDRAAQLQPPCDLESFGPASPEQQACIEQVRDEDGFNWGYDPFHYTTPEGSYATDPSGAARTAQFRSMVQSLNGSGLRVVMDVVYNHTNAAGQADKSVLDRIVPGYYHRLLDDGSVANSTCCANTATEHAMMEKLMVDSLVTWARDYKVDGFRFDLMGHHSRANMLAVRAALDELTLADDGVDGSSIYLYGEGWNFGEVANNARFVQATQLEMAGTGIGTFNDRLRDAVRGGGPFDGDQRLNQGFASGLFTDPNEFQTLSPADQKARLLLLQDQIKVGLAGNLEDFTFVDRTGATVSGAQVDYNGAPAGYTSDPQEAITYVEAHDNETLFDILAYKLPQPTSAAQRARAQVVGLSTALLGQGVPFLHAGSELLRSKSLDKNSYDSGDWFNRVFFDGSANNFAVGLPRESDNGAAWPIIGPILQNAAIEPAPGDIAWTAARVEELLEIRATSRLFRLGTAADVGARLSFANNGPDQVPGLIVMRISDKVGADLDPDARSLVIVFNASDTTQSFSLPDTAKEQFLLHKIQRNSEDETVTLSKFAQKTGTFTVPARTTAVFVELQPGRPR
jgi:pullulanase-type alpha-1,6-glucosidase